MYATCLFCNNALGRNEALEHFPVGRRLAFDSATGRLWVICGKCQRWNLSPLETRWEAIEEAERAFRNTKVRMATDNIGLARLREGLDLVRIGAPLRPEFAAWRYGHQFGKRRRKVWLYGGATLAVPLAFVGYKALHFVGVTGAVVIPSAAVSGFLMLNNVRQGYQSWSLRNRAPYAIRDDDGNLLRLTAVNVNQATILPEGKGSSWHLTVPHVDVSVAEGWRRKLGLTGIAGYEHVPRAITGNAAVHALATLLPALNKEGGSTRAVNDAVEVVSENADLGRILRGETVTKLDSNKYFRLTRELSRISHFPAHIRLAMEMSVHEDAERRAMEGELHELEQRWKDADAIAKIADEMFLPFDMNDRMTSMRERDNKR